MQIFAFCIFASQTLVSATAHNLEKMRDIVHKSCNVDQQYLMHLGLCLRVLRLEIPSYVDVHLGLCMDPETLNSNPCPVYVRLAVTLCRAGHWKHNVCT